MELPRLRSLALIGAPVLAVIAVAVLMIFATGHDVSDAAVAAWRGSVGSPFAVLSATLKRATPLILLGVALAVAFRAGVLNIGADGQFLAGAVACVAAGVYLPARAGALVMIPVELIAAVVAGGCWAGLAAWLKAKHRITEVVSTLLLNFVALHLVGYLIRGPLQEPTGSYPQSLTIPVVARLPLLIPGNRLHLGFVLAVVVAAAAWAYLRYAAGGFRVRAVGANPAASASAGQIPVRAVQARVLVMSGAIAGLAGACEVAGVTYTVYEGLSPGYGYTAIGVALLAGLRPLPVVAAAMFFGALGAGADAMQRDAGVPAEIAVVVSALVVLTVLALPMFRMLAHARRLRAQGAT